MTRTDPALTAFLEEQRADYTRSLPRRLEQVGLLWQQILRGEDLASALPTLERHAHSLAGSAATFGWAINSDFNIVRNFQGFVLIVRHEHAGDAEFVMQTAQPLPQVLSDFGIQSAERFVEEQELRLDGERARQCDPLSLSAG